MSTAITAAVDRWQQTLKDYRMGSDGLFQAELHCLGCGKLLNADGNHPAEVHAGCFTGLCYGCTGKGRYVLAIAVLDGCRKISYPPHCPSWRRARETYYAYPDCTACKGWGVTGIGREGYRHHCADCLSRCTTHPGRAREWEWNTKIFDSANRVYRAAVLREAGAPKRVSQRRQNEILGAVSPEDKERISAPIRARTARLVALNAARAMRLELNVWLPPALWTTEDDWKAA